MSDSIDKDEQRQKLVEAIDRLFEHYRGVPKYPYEKKVAKRDSYRSVLLEIVDELISAQINTLLDKLEAQAHTYNEYIPAKAIPLSAIHKLRRELNGEKV